MEIGIRTPQSSKMSIPSPSSIAGRQRSFSELRTEYLGSRWLDPASGSEPARDSYLAMEGYWDMSPQPLLEMYFTVDEVAESLGVSTRSVRRWIASGELVAHWFGRSVRIAESDLKAFKERRSGKKK
jgi:excisionase family DNA binding protein